MATFDHNANPARTPQESPGSLGYRYIAYTIDSALACGVTFLLVALFVSISGIDFRLIDKARFALAAEIVFCWAKVWFESSAMAATPGKTLLGLSIATLDGARPTLHQTLIRNIPFLIIGIAKFLTILTSLNATPLMLSGYLIFLGVTVSIISSHRRTGIHDRVSNLRVVLNAHRNKLPQYAHSGELSGYNLFWCAIIAQNIILLGLIASKSIQTRKYVREEELLAVFLLAFGAFVASHFIPKLYRRWKYHTLRQSSATTLSEIAFKQSIRRIGGHSFVLGMILLCLVGTCGVEIALLTQSFRAGAILLGIAMVEMIRRFPSMERWRKESVLS